MLHTSLLVSLLQSERACRLPLSDDTPVVFTSAASGAIPSADAKPDAIASGGASDGRIPSGYAKRTSAEGVGGGARLARYYRPEQRRS
jgi:hypothetical protein